MMIIQAGSLIEIKKLNPHVTDREFVPFHQVARIYKSVDGYWYATLIDGSQVVLLDGPEED